MQKSVYSVKPFRDASMFSFCFGKADNYYGTLVHSKYTLKFRAALLNSMYAATSPFT